MKTTLDLPDQLVRAMKLKAVHEDRNIKDVAAALIKAGLEIEEAKARTASSRKGKIKLPLFPGAGDAPARGLGTAELLALIQTTQNQEDHKRLGLSP